MEGLTSPLVLALFSAVGAWLAISVAAVGGRVAHERRESAQSERRPPTRARSRRRMLGRASSHRTERGKWRRISALRTLVHGSDQESRRLLQQALFDGDQDIVSAAVRLLGDLGDTWAVGELIELLRKGTHPRSRVATALDAHTPKIGRRLVPLLRDADPAVRFWAATLLARCPGVATAKLVMLTRDTDGNVRAAAVEALGTRGDERGLAAIQRRLDDELWFVRVHAYRAVGRLGGLSAVPAIAVGLRDARWWVRTAAKDALRDLGPAVAGALIPYLADDDAFARNGAAEVLQDVGFVDGLSRYGAEGDLLERIFLAGGAGLRHAAVRRAADRPAVDERALGEVAS